MKTITRIFVAAALFASATFAHAAILIQAGHSYSFSGYLIIHLSQQAPAVLLSAYPNGEVPPHVIGRQDLVLTNGTFTQNLLTVARKIGATKQVTISGIGQNGGTIAVNTLAEARAATPPPHPPVNPIVHAARQDAVARFVKLVPALAGFTAKVKGMQIDQASGQIKITVGQLKDGSNPASWGAKGMLFIYDKTGKFISQANA